MKRLSVLAILVLCVVSLCLPTFAAEPTTYLELKATASEIQPEISCKVTGLEGGATYNFYANVKFEDITGTNFGYIAVYNYTVDHFTNGSVRPESFLDLGAWVDVVQCTAGSSADWQEVSATLTLDETTACTMINLGFWQAGGTIKLADARLEDASGNVVWSEDWSDGFDASAWVEYVKDSQKDDAAAYMDSVELIGYAPVIEEIAAEVAPEAAAAPAETVSAPQTGDFETIACVVLAAAAVAACVLLPKKSGRGA